MKFEESLNKLLASALSAPSRITIKIEKAKEKAVRSPGGELNFYSPEDEAEDLLSLLAGAPYRPPAFQPTNAINRNPFYTDILRNLLMRETPIPVNPSPEYLLGLSSLNAPFTEMPPSTNPLEELLMKTAPAPRSPLEELLSRTSPQAPAMLEGLPLPQTTAPKKVDLNRLLLERMLG